MEFNTNISFREEVGGLIYKTIESEIEVAQCYQLYQKSFMKDEPITKNFRDKKEQKKKEIQFFDDELFYGPIKDGVSLIVVDPENGNKVIGMRISALVERNNNTTTDEAEAETEENLSSFSFYTQFVFHCFGQVGCPEDVLAVHTDLNKATFI